MKARELMRRDLTSVEHDTTVREAIYIMEHAGLSSLPVLDDAGVLVGIISQKKLIRDALPGYLEMLHSASFLPDLNQLSKRLKEMADEPVSNYMDTDVISIHPDDEDLQVADTLIRNELKQVPVVDEAGCLLGVIRRIDLLYRLV